MPIKRSSDQKSISLEEFYIDLSDSSLQPYTVIGQHMLQFVQLINETFKNTLIWGLTSHARLVLQNKDDWSSEWFVIISNIGTNDFYFEYLMPIDTRPWENAYIHGQAKSIEQARDFMIIAMTESEGWIGNEELKQLRVKLR